MLQIHDNLMSAWQLPQNTSWLLSYIFLNINWWLDWLSYPWQPSQLQSWHLLKFETGRQQLRAYEAARNSAQPKKISTHLIVIWCGNYFFDMSMINFILFLVILRLLKHTKSCMLAYTVYMYPVKLIETAIQSRNHIHWVLNLFMAMFTAKNVMITSTIWNLRRCQMLLHGVPQKALDVVSGTTTFLTGYSLSK